MNETLRILKMVEEGKVTAEQGAGLLAAAEKNDYDKKLFRVIVNSSSGDKVKVQFPVGAVKKMLKVTGKLPIPEKDLQGIDLAGMMDAISACLEDEIEGDFVNVESSDGTTVRAYVDR